MIKGTILIRVTGAKTKRDENNIDDRYGCNIMMSKTKTIKRTTAVLIMITLLILQNMMTL